MATESARQIDFDPAITYTCSNDGSFEARFVSDHTLTPLNIHRTQLKPSGLSDRRTRDGNTANFEAMNTASTQLLPLKRTVSCEKRKEPPAKRQLLSLDTTHFNVSHTLASTKPARSSSSYMNQSSVYNNVSNPQHVLRETILNKFAAYGVQSSRSSAITNGCLEFGDFDSDTWAKKVPFPKKNEVKGSVGYLEDDSRLPPTKTPATGDVVGCDSEDEYPFDELEETDVVDLLDGCTTYNNAQIPPSSVANAWDRDSRSANEYDPNLQYSSRPSTAASTEQPFKGQDRIPGSPSPEEDLLDEDVDWDEVYAITNSIPKDQSLAGSRNLQAVNQRPISEQGATKSPAKNEISGVKHASQSALAVKSFSLMPLSLLPFPDRAYDNSSISGLSLDTVLRTFFHMGEMMDHAAHSCRKQDTIFEFYARVTYSSRESLNKKQHFQFADLIRDEKPWISGVLADWKVGGVLDDSSQAFLGASSGQKLCWCLCKAKKDPKSVNGWNLEILNVREADWSEIQLRKKSIFHGSDQGHVSDKQATTQI